MKKNSKIYIEWMAWLLACAVLIAAASALMAGRESRLPARVTAPGGAGEPYLGGGELMLIASADGGQNQSVLIRTPDGSLIVVDGGLPADADHLTGMIQQGGGRVAAWLITHPHSDHIGALTEILKQDPLPVEIDGIYYNFLDRADYERGEHMNRMDNLDHLLEAMKRLDPEKLHTPLETGETIRAGNARITVLNQPFYCDRATFNNSSVAFRIDMAGRRLLFLGDMGWEAGENLIARTKPEDLKADVVQMAHHGQAGVGEEVYELIAPDVCLWPTPRWLWNNEKDGKAGAGSFKTPEVRGWMAELGVKYNLVVEERDQILR